MSCSPAALLSLLPVALLPVGAAARAVPPGADRSPAAAEHRVLVVRRAGPWRPDGFPAPHAACRRCAGRSSRTALLTGAAAAAVLLLAGGVVFAADLMHHAGRRPLALAATPPGGGSSSGSPLGTGSASPGSARKHDKSARAPDGQPDSRPGRATTRRPRPPRPPGAARRAQPVRVAQPVASPSPSPSRTPPPAPGTLTASATTVRLTQAAEGGPYTGSFTLTATGGPVHVQHHGLADRRRAVHLTGRGQAGRRARP